ncbi:hypothetical protein [Mycolicibacterium nivoides]|uniref:Uncharacterized protein n=1 Tax=Mycolicibacterium nivoides TaxID=2487344 RepID=A0ABW9LKN7_9MYCO
MSHIINPEAVGNPDMTPVVQVDQDTADWLREPANGGCTHCNGINWVHTPTCPQTDVVERANALQEGTTPGPWGTDGSMIASELVKVSPGVTQFKQSIAEMDEDSYLSEDEDDDYDGEYPPYEQKEADARFIAASRALVPEMAAEIVRLRERVKAMNLDNANISHSLQVARAQLKIAKRSEQAEEVSDE